MAYNFGQMFQKKGIQGQAGGGVPSYPPTPTKPPMPQAGGGKPSQQLLGPPVQEPKPGVMPDGGPSYHPPGPSGPPARPYPYPQPPVPGGPGPKGAGDRGRAMIGQPGGQWGMLPPGGGGRQNPPQGGSGGGGYQGPYYGDYRDYIPGGVYYVPGADPNIDNAYASQNPGWKPGDPPVGTAQPPQQQPVWGGGRAPVPGGGRYPNPGGPQSYMPYFNPAGGVRYDPNYPGIPGVYY